MRPFFPGIGGKRVKEKRSEEIKKEMEELHQRWEVIAHKFEGRMNDLAREYNRRKFILREGLLLYGDLPTEQQEALQRELSALARKYGLHLDGYDGKHLVAVYT